MIFYPKKHFFEVVSYIAPGWGSSHACFAGCASEIFAFHVLFTSLLPEHLVCHQSLCLGMGNAFVPQHIHLMFGFKGNLDGV